VRRRAPDFAELKHPRDRRGRFMLKGESFRPRDRSGKVRPDLRPPAPARSPAAPGGGKARQTAAGGARERLAGLLDRLRQFRDHAREHGVPAAVAARALAAIATLDEFFNRPGGEAFHPLASDPLALLDNWGAVRDSLKAMAELGAHVGPAAAQSLLRLLTGYARGELPDDERRLVEAWLRESDRLDAAERGVPGARALAEAAGRELDLIAGRSDVAFGA
jgi:hypothetical protein